MDSREPNAASPFTTGPRQGETGPTNGQTPSSPPVVDPALQRLVYRTLGLSIGLPLTSSATMATLDVLAAHGVPVPALGFWDTLIVLGTALILRVLFGRLT